MFFFFKNEVMSILNKILSYKLIKTILRFFIDFIVSVVFLFLSLFLIFSYSNLKKIIKTKGIIIHKAGGFGHQCLVNDIIRYSKRKYLYILLFDRTRFNKYISLCFNIPHIYIPTCTGSQLAFQSRFNFKFGEYEGSKFNFIELFLILILKKVLKKKVLYLKQYYNLFVNDNKNLLKNIDFYKEKFKDFNAYGDIYFYFIRNYKKNKPKLPTVLFNKVIENLQFKKINYQKICTIYLRQKGSKSSDLSNSSRAGSKKHDYFDLFNELVSKNYTLFLVGDELLSPKDLKKFHNRVINHNHLNISKDLFQIFSLLNNSLYIGEAGGAQYFGLYSKFSIGINFFPLGYIIPYDRILYKNIYGKKNYLLSRSEKKKNSMEI